jgi:hypothetical protein
MLAARSARTLLRNGLDFLSYQEYDRALEYLKEAETRQRELTTDEVKSLKQGIEQAQRGLRELADSPSPTYAKSRVGKGSPGAIAATPTRGRRAKEAVAREPVQLASGETTTGPAPLADQAPAIPATLPEQLAPAVNGRSDPAKRRATIPVTDMPLTETAPPAVPPIEPPSTTPAPIELMNPPASPDLAQPGTPPSPLASPPAPEPLPLQDPAEAAIAAAPRRDRSGFLDGLPAVTNVPAPAAAPAESLPTQDLPDEAPPARGAGSAILGAGTPPAVPPSASLPDPSAGARTTAPATTTTGPDDSPLHRLLAQRAPHTSILSPELRREVEEIAQRQDEEEARRRAAQPTEPSATTIEGEQPTARLELPRAPSPTEARPLRAIPVPDEFITLMPRNWSPTRKYWAAAATCHTPLYFQDVSLERYGHSVEQYFGSAGRFMTYPIDDPRQSNQRNQIVQPFISGGLFALQIALLPFNVLLDAPWEAEYDLGYWRPGDRIPSDLLYLPVLGVGPPLHGASYGPPR